MFTFDEFWGSLDASIFWNPSSASDNTRSRLPSRLSLRFLWLCFNKLEKLLTGSLLQNDCFEKFEKISSKTSVVVYCFWFHQQKDFTEDVFFGIFSNISEHLRTAFEIIQENSFIVFFSTEVVIHRSFNQKFLTNRLSSVYYVKLWAITLKT